MSQIKPTPVRSCTLTPTAAAAARPSQLAQSAAACLNKVDERVCPCIGTFAAEYESLLRRLKHYRDGDVLSMREGRVHECHRQRRRVPPLRRRLLPVNGGAAVLPALPGGILLGALLKSMNKSIIMNK